MGALPRLVLGFALLFIWIIILGVAILCLKEDPINRIFAFTVILVGWLERGVVKENFIFR